MMMGGGDGDSPGATNQFIGSKISLISKSEIRYEGILYSLDLDEATISLQKVRSFGTEDRPTARCVAPKDEVYEFIIFRGSDIKGIDVLEPPPAPKDAGRDEEPVDPAIVEVQHYQAPSQSIGPSSSNEHHHAPQQQQPAAPLPQQNNFGSGYLPQANNLIGGGPNPPHHVPVQQPFNIGVGFGGGVPQQIVAAPRQAGPSASPPTHQQPAVGLSSPDGKNSREQRPQNNLSSGSAPQQQQQQRRAYAPRGRGGGQQQQQMNVQGQGQPPQQRVYQQGQQQGRGMSSNRGFGGYGYNRFGQGNGQGGQRNYFRRGELKGNKKLTFDGEFDFEKANEELQKALMKIKIADGGGADEEVNESVAAGSGIPVEDDSGGEEGAGGEEKDNKENDKSFYSKDNFFDSISCEALERKSGKREKPDWRAERKLNAETFGLPLKARGSSSSSTYYRGGGYNNYNNSYAYSRGGGGGGGGGYGGYSRNNNYHRGGYRGGGRGYGGGRGMNPSNGRGVNREQQRVAGD